MFRAYGTPGFAGRAAQLTSPQITGAVAASLAIAAFSLGLIVALTVLSAEVAAAMPPSA